MQLMPAVVCREDELRVVRRDPLEVAVRIAPYTGEDTRHQYVCASLSLTTPAGYPETPAEFLLSDIKGAQPVVCPAAPDSRFDWPA